jgi:outer membrane protein
LDRGNRQYRHRSSVAADADGAVVLWRSSSKVRPYIGAGINYTTFFNETLTIPVKRPDFRSEPERLLGAAGQVGLDYLINRDWLMNMSVWYMDIDTDAN